jgi:glutathione S-transferase
MLKIFHAPRTRSSRIVWLAEEMGLPYEIQPVSFQDKSPEFLALNPTGTLPAVVDGDLVLTESVAILLYMCERYGPTPLAVRPDGPTYADFLQFLVLGEAGLAAPLNAMFGCRFIGQPEDLDVLAVRVIIEGYMRRLKLVTRQLKRFPYMAGDAFTAADITVASAIGMGIFLDLGDKIPATAKDYHARVTARPAYERATAV